MKIQGLLLVVSLATSTVAAIFDSSTGLSPSSDETFKVPGDNPLEHCQDPKHDILDLESVDLDPNPPLPYVALANIHERGLR